MAQRRPNLQGFFHALNVLIELVNQGEPLLALLRGDRVRARVSIEKLLERVAQLGCDGLVTPLEVWLVCYRVLAANNDPRAHTVHERALAVLHEQAGWIDEPDERRVFLENVPAHHAILAATTHEARYP